MGEVVPLDAERRQRRAEETVLVKAGRKESAQWLTAVEDLVRSAQLIAGDLVIGKALMNFPSSVKEGFCGPAIAGGQSWEVTRHHKAVGPPFEGSGAARGRAPRSQPIGKVFLHNTRRAPIWAGR